MERIELNVDNLSVSYGKFKISGISFSLQNGDIMGVVGRSGSGKSTIIKALVGTKKHSSGTITFSKDTKKVSLNKVIGYSPQENALFPFLTLEENMMTFGRLYNLSKKNIDERSSFLLKRLDLTQSRNKRITEMSGGMQKRADLAVTLLHNPEVIILDEPFNGLDVALQKFIWKLLHELAEEGKIIIVSSHLLADVQKNCNQFGLVEAGNFYNTKELIKHLRKYKQDLSCFLEGIFMDDLVND